MIDRINLDERIFDSSGLNDYSRCDRYKGWTLIHGAKGERLVKEGVYSYVRYPEYVGLFLITSEHESHH